MSNATTNEVRVGVYNGKRFKVLFAGKTKHGERAKLCWFSDETKAFWVDLNKVQIVENSPAPTPTPKPPVKPPVKPTGSLFDEPYEDEGDVYDSGDCYDDSPYDAPPIANKVAKPVGKGSTTCACGCKKKPQFSQCYGCYQEACE